MEDMRIEIPIEFEGQSKSKDKSFDKLEKGISKLDKTMYLTLDVFEMLSDIMLDVYRVIQPIFKLLSLLFLIILMPLMPVIKAIAKGLAWLAKLFSGGIGDLAQFIGKMLLAIILGALAVILIGLSAPLWAIVGLIVVVIALLWDYIVMAGKIIWEGMKWVGEKIVDAVIWSWEKIKEGFSIIWNGLKWVWNELLLPAWIWLKDMFFTIWEDYIKPPFIWLASVGIWIWEQILKPAFEWFKDIGSRIWGVLKSAFTSAVDYIKNAIRRMLPGGSSRSVNDAIITPQGNVIETHPRDYIIATKEPHKLGGNQGITININNPVVREQADIKKIADETSKILERKLWRSY